MRTVKNQEGTGIVEETIRRLQQQRMAARSTTGSTTSPRDTEVVPYHSLESSNGGEAALALAAAGAESAEGEGEKNDYYQDEHNRGRSSFVRPFRRGQDEEHPLLVENPEISQLDPSSSSRVPDGDITAEDDDDVIGEIIKTFVPPAAAAPPPRSPSRPS